MEKDLQRTAYYYNLPEENIAQKPADKRDHSKLMIVDCAHASRTHTQFSEILDQIRENDILVVNNTKVFPARLSGHKESGGKAEVFLLEFPEILAAGRANGFALIKSSRRPKEDSIITINPDLSCRVKKLLERGKAELELIFTPEKDLANILADSGEIPLPPYIKREGGTTREDAERYQTVYASAPGAVAAPTAGLHFSHELIQKLNAKGVTRAEVTLHVGYGTFAPVQADNITEHQIHEEFVTVSQETVEKINQARKKGGRVWAVGTTTVRSLEWAAKENGGTLAAYAGWCKLYIYPGFEFKVIDNLITNFHLPDSSLMFLVAALCGRETLLDCYESAIKRDYRFFSYGDAMAIVRA